MPPDVLIALLPEQIERLVMDFVDDMEGRDYSKSYKNTLIKRLQTFFRVNGHPSLKLRTHFMPSRYRKRKEYIPTKDEVYRIADASGSVRNRALVLCLWSSGLRVSTLCALDFGDVAGELGQQCVRFQVFPEMKERVPDACKGSIPYYTFISHEATEVLRSALRQREERFGRIGPSEPLFSSDWTLWKRKERPMRRPAPRTRMRPRGAKQVRPLVRTSMSPHHKPYCPTSRYSPIMGSPGKRRPGITVPREELAEFCRSNHISRLALFGSAIHGDQTPESDLDVLVVFEKGRAPGLDFFRMQDELSRLFGRRVDLNTPHFLSPYFRERVMREAEVLYAG